MLNMAVRCKEKVNIPVVFALLLVVSLFALTSQIKTRKGTMLFENMPSLKQFKLTWVDYSRGLDVAVRFPKFLKMYLFDISIVWLCVV